MKGRLFFLYIDFKGGGGEEPGERFRGGRLYGRVKSKKGGCRLHYYRVGRLLYL